MEPSTLQTRRRVTQAVALLISLSVTASALAASPAKGAKFNGTATGKVTFATTFTAKDPLGFTASSHAEELSSLTYTDNVCGFASSKIVQVGTVKLAAGGTFSLLGHASAPEGDALKDGRKVVTTTTITGVFVSPTKAQGTLEYTQKENGSPSSRCGPIKLKFTATAS